MRTTLAEGEIVQQSYLKRVLGRFALYVLTAEDVERQPRQRRQQTKFRILRFLDASKISQRLRVKYTTGIFDAVTDALGTVTEVLDELIEWKDSMEGNEGLQSTYTFELLETAIGELDGLDLEPEEPEISNVPTIVVLPDISGRTGRLHRLEVAAYTLRGVIDLLEDLEVEPVDEIDAYHDALESIADAVENVEIPVLYAG